MKKIIFRLICCIFNLPQFGYTYFEKRMYTTRLNEDLPHMCLG